MCSVLFLLQLRGTTIFTGLHGARSGTNAHGMIYSMNKSWVVGLSITVTVLIVAGFMLAYFRASKTLVIPPAATRELKTTQQSATYKLHGRIYLSLANAAMFFPEPAVLDLDAGTLSPDGTDGESIGYEHHVSAQENRIAFIGTSKDLVEQAREGAITLGDAVQVYVGTLGTDGAVPAPSASTVVTHNSQIEKRTPVVSPDGAHLLYVTNSPGVRPSDLKTRSLDTYDIHVVSLAQAPAADTTLAHGIHPGWLSDDAFFYVATDGLREYSLSQATSSLLLPFAGSTNIKFGISPDASALALSMPDAHTIYLFELDARTFPARIGASRELPVLGFWTLFSPDGTAIAVQTASDENADGSREPRIDFYDVATLKKLPQTVSLSPFDNDRLFMTSWK